MEITIIGWYGTETIGDRAILAGIFRLLSLSYGKYNVRLGSLYPFFSQRTVLEDLDFYKISSQNNNLQISIFDSLEPSCLKNNIKKSDLLLVGGGPLEDLKELNMLSFAFTYAKKHKVKSVLLGCGWGPLKSNNYKELCKGLVENSSLTIFRDKTSLEVYERLCPHHNNRVYCLLDPAFVACEVFLEVINRKPKWTHIAINFRDVSTEGNKYMNDYPTEDFLCDFVRELIPQLSLPIFFVPMHNFYIGGDDRVYLEKLEKRLSNENVKTLHEPQSLFRTMEYYYDAFFCVGMRFHSIVLQTVLNGKNIVLDYTDPATGKTIGMMKTTEMLESYKNRYFSLHGADSIKGINVSSIDRFCLKEGYLHGIVEKYVELMKDIGNG